jgi:drug/metabolite transporter (DMT)-like permease
MIWLYIIIIAYLLFALANVGDKFVISKFKTQAIVYAFYVGAMGVVTLVLIPFGVIWPDLNQFVSSMIGGVSFVFALYFMYLAINAGETTRAITIIGSTSPIFTFLLSFLVLKERLSSNQLIAFIILILAIIVISWQFEKSQQKMAKKQLMFALLAGLIFAISYVSAKYVYIYQPFISGFVWIRVGGVLTALSILIFAKNRQLIKIDWQRPKTQKGSLILAIQILGGTGVIGQNYAFSIASATIINALQAIQYAFVFILTSLLGKKFPVLKENLNSKQIIQKVVAIILIAIGLYFLAL